MTLKSPLLLLLRISSYIFLFSYYGAFLLCYRISSNIRLASITRRPLIDASSIYIEMTINVSL